VIHDQDNAEKLVYTFWNHVVVNMREWNEMDSGELSKKSLREDYITTQGLIILALGRLGEFYCVNPQINMAKSLKELKKNKMSVVATGILFGVMGVLIIPMIAVIIKISNALSQKHPRIYKYSMIAFIGMLLAISLFCVVIKHQMSFLVIVACLAITLCDTIKNR